MPSPEEERLQGLLSANKILTFLLAVVLLACAFIFFKHLLITIGELKKTGLDGKSVLQIFAAVADRFFFTFGPLTGKYLIQAGAWSLIVIILPVFSFFRKVEFPAIAYWGVVLIAVVLALALPVDRAYAWFVDKGGAANNNALCMLLMIVAPFVLSHFLGRFTITRKISRKLMFVFLFGLLVLQIFLEG
jgi:hypothetical protein